MEISLAGTASHNTVCPATSPASSRSEFVIVPFGFSSDTTRSWISSLNRALHTIGG